jgi:dihydrolipoamide dehydrogenase
MLREEDKEVADAFTRIFSKKHKIILGYAPKSARQKGKKIAITAENGKKKIRLETDSLLVATGRIPNTDTLDTKRGGIELTEKGYVKVNEYLETSAPNTWALGDIAGKYALKHSANLEAEYAIRNMLHGERAAVDYWPMPHAIFTSPQIAAVGFTEEELKERRADYAVGRYEYKRTAMGLALGNPEGFCKLLADRQTRKLLGCHIIGPDASTLIHEVIVAMKAGLTPSDISGATHVHPALSEVVQRAANNME